MQGFEVWGLFFLVVKVESGQGVLCSPVWSLALTARSVGSQSSLQRRGPDQSCPRQDHKSGNVNSKLVMLLGRRQGELRDLGFFGLRAFSAGLGLRV